MAGPRRSSLVKHTNPLNREMRLDIGNKLKKTRIRLFGDGFSNLTTAALKASMDPGQYTKYEKSLVLPTLPVLANLLHSWGVTWKEFHND